MLDKRRTTRRAIVNNCRTEVYWLLPAYIKGQISGTGIGWRQPTILIQGHAAGQQEGIGVLCVDAVIQLIDIQGIAF